MDKANGIKVKKPLRPLNKLKDDAWDLCSIYVRRTWADARGMVKCYTCPAVKHWKEMQAGHLVPGRSNGILFDLRGIRPQCFQCNCRKQGMTVEFLFELEKEIGFEKAVAVRAELRINSKIPRPSSRPELEELIKWFKVKISQIESRG